jgi:hypothetical protein
MAWAARRGHSNANSRATRTVAFRRGDSGYTNAAGHPIALPADGADRAASCVEIGGHEVAAIVHDAALAHDAELVEALCAAAGIVIENERLHAESETRLAGAAGLRATHRRCRRRRATPPRAQPARRRAAATGRPRHAATARPSPTSDVTPAAAEALVTSACDPLMESLAELANSRAGCTHCPRARPTVSAHVACVALDGSHGGRLRPNRAPAPARRARALPATPRTFIAGRQSTGAKRRDRRLARYRVAEGRISHLKRRDGLGRSRLKGHRGARTWTAWGILAYNLHTIAFGPPDSIHQIRGPHARTPTQPRAAVLCHPRRGRCHSPPFIRGK